MDILGYPLNQRIADWLTHLYIRRPGAGCPPPSIDFYDRPQPVGIHQGQPLLAIGRIEATGRLLSLGRPPWPGRGLDLVLGRGGMSLPLTRCWDWWVDYQDDGVIGLNWMPRYARTEPDLSQIEWFELVGVAPPAWVRPHKKFRVIGRLCARRPEVDDKRLIVVVDQWEAA